ncbi:hypothetical protein BH23CHL8_BH23CHL8_27740 [soil metagenome]
MSRISATAFEEFDRLAGLFGRTRTALDEVAAGGRVSPATSSLLAVETLPHIDDVEAGFRAKLRASDGNLEELRGLILQGGMGLAAPRNGPEARAALIEAMQALSGAGGPRNLVAAEGADLAALEHAQIAMAILPFTDSEDVRFRGRPSYADIAAPRGLAEFAARIEEVERVIWQVAAGRQGDTRGSAWRRVYAFFDAGERLSSQGPSPA